jgi:serine/threonine protein phosphatase 1
MADMLSLFRRQPKADLPAGQRLYAIGDVHGRLDLLDALLDRIDDDNSARKPAETHVLLLGDLIDRGPYSSGVVRRIMAGDDRFASLGALKGNHEASLLAVLAGETQWLASWLDYGGRASLRSWGVDDAVLRSEDEEAIVASARAAVPADQHAWLAALPTRHRAGDYLFVHAGVRPGVAIDAQSDDDLLWIRGEFLNDRSDHGVVVVHGHTICREPELRTNRIGIDTGAYLSGALTAVGLEDGERWFLATGSG